MLHLKSALKFRFLILALVSPPCAVFDSRALYSFTELELFQVLQFAYFNILTSFMWALLHIPWPPPTLDFLHSHLSHFLFKTADWVSDLQILISTHVHIKAMKKGPPRPSPKPLFPTSDFTGFIQTLSPTTNATKWPVLGELCSSFEPLWNYINSTYANQASSPASPLYH